MVWSVAHTPAHQQREFLSFLRVLGINQNAIFEFSLYYIPRKSLAYFSFHYLRKTRQEQNFLVNTSNPAPGIGDLHSFLNSATNIQCVWATQSNIHSEVKE